MSTLAERYLGRSNGFFNQGQPQRITPRGFFEPNWQPNFNKSQYGQQPSIPNMPQPSPESALMSEMNRLQPGGAPPSIIPGVSRPGGMQPIGRTISPTTEEGWERVRQQQLEYRNKYQGKPRIEKRKLGIREIPRNGGRGLIVPISGGMQRGISRGIQNSSTGQRSVTPHIRSW